MALTKHPVSSSIGITIKPPTGFGIDGDTEVNPTIESSGSKILSDKDVFLGELYSYLDFIETQKKKVLELISQVKLSQKNP